MATSLFTRKVDHRAKGADPRLDVITVQITFDLVEGVNKAIWVCPTGERYRLHAAYQIHTTKTATATTHLVQLRRQQGTEAPASGDALLTDGSGTGFDLMGTDETLQTGTLHADTADGTLDFVGGNRLGIAFTESGSSATALVGACITAVLIPIHRSRYAL